MTSNITQKDKIIELQKEVNIKNQEISQLKKSIKNTIDNGVKFKPGDNIISIGFISMNQKIKNYNRAYKDNEIVARIEEELYNEYPEFKEKDTFLFLHANKIQRFKSLIENNIKNGDVILVFFYEEYI